MGPIDRLERWMAGLVRGWSARFAGPHGDSLIEIRRGVLNEVKGRLEPKGRGQYAFPYRTVAVRIHAADPERRDAYEAAFLDDASLENEIRELLAEAGCAARDLSVSVSVEDGAGEPFAIEFQRAARQQAAPAARPAAKLTVLSGSAETPELVSSADRINIGRLAEVVSRTGGLIRRNDLAFADTEATVGREHAHIDYKSGQFRLCDDISGERGTRVFRGGRPIVVPRASLRGLRLQSGDEIHLGQARIRFELVAPC